MFLLGIGIFTVFSIACGVVGSGGIVTLSTTLSNANPVLNPVGTSGICTIFQLAPITVSLGFAPSLPANNGFTLSRY